MSLPICAKGPLRGAIMPILIAPWAWASPTAKASTATTRLVSHARPLIHDSSCSRSTRGELEPPPRCRPAVYRGRRAPRGPPPAVGFLEESPGVFERHLAHAGLREV